MINFGDFSDELTVLELNIQMMAKITKSIEKLNTVNNYS